MSPIIARILVCYNWGVKKKRADSPISWLPVDSRLFSPFLSFGHVKGLARFFLEIEIVLAVLIVLGTVLYLILYFLS